MARKREWLSFWCPLGVGVATTGAALAWPDAGVLLIAFGVAIIGGSLAYQRLQLLPSAVLGSLVGLAAFGMFEFRHPSVISIRQPPSFRRVFDLDLQGSGGSISEDLPVSDTTHNQVVELPIRSIWNEETNTKYLAILLPERTDRKSLCFFVLTNLKNIQERLSNIYVTTSIPGDTAPTTSRSAAFSKIIYFYMESDMSLTDQASVEQAFKAAGIDIHFRGQAYYTLRWNDPKFEARPPAMSEVKH